MPNFINVDNSRAVCRHMSTKALHVYGQDTSDAFHTSRSSGYQCLKTSFVTGPDGGLCVPESCQPGRDCFRSR